MESSIMKKALPISAMFEELIQLGHITPELGAEDTTLPGAYPTVPTITSYDTPKIPVHLGVHTNAKLGQHS
jgi:hypothetical protein